MKKVILAIVSALGLATMMVACGSSGGGSSSSPSTAAVGTCGTSGYVQTQYGCLPEYNGNPNYGNYNGYAVPVTSTYTYGTYGTNGNPYYVPGAVNPQTPYPYYNYNYNYQNNIYNNKVYPSYGGGYGAYIQIY